MDKWLDTRGDWDAWAREVGEVESLQNDFAYYAYCNRQGTGCYIPKPPTEVDIFLPPKPDEYDLEYDPDYRSDDWREDFG